MSRPPDPDTVTGLDGWQPLEQTETDGVTASAARALHGLLDAPGPPPGPGEVLPALWHWLAFLPTCPQSELGVDGHPRLGAFLPPVALPRRMFAGGSLTWSGALEVGEAIVRRGVVSSVEAKHGRSGPLVFATVSYRLGRADGGDPAVLVEDQHLVYRGPDGAGAGGPEAGPDDAGWELGLDLDISPTLLFRFSALTYNAHRIHYDRRYATEEEGYPGLVVHGPLQAVGLAEVCRRHLPGRRLTGFAFRALAPAFDDGRLQLRGRADESGSVELAAFAGGRQTMSARASTADAGSPG